MSLIKLINQALRADPIALSPDVQRICDPIIGARPDFLLLADVSGVIHFATDACESPFGVSAPALEVKPLASLLQTTGQQNFSQFLHDRINPLGRAVFLAVGAYRLAHQVGRRRAPGVR